nr:hypothetical protein CFP56_39309 [Quercus suber]
MRMESEMMSQNKEVQSAAGGTSKPAEQRGEDGTLAVSPENIPRKDTGPRDVESNLRVKEKDQRADIGAWVEADFVKVLEKIDASIEGERVNAPDTSQAKLQGVFCGKGLIDVDIQEAKVSTNLNIVSTSQEFGDGPVVGSSKLGFKFEGGPMEISKLNRANRNSCQGYKDGKTNTKAHNVGKNISPSKGKSKQGSWKRKEGRHAEETLLLGVNVNMDHVARLVMIAWKVWQSRNERRLGGVSRPGSQLTFGALQLWAEFLAANGSESCSGSAVQAVYWEQAYYREVMAGMARLKVWNFEVSWEVLLLLAGYGYTSSCN